MQKKKQNDAALPGHTNETKKQPILPFVTQRNQEVKKKKS
jgi:hypothetical protein